MGTHRGGMPGEGASARNRENEGQPMTATQNQSARKYVIGPYGSPLTMADLPPPDTTRWVPRRKAEVVAAVRGGLLTLEDACARWSLTTEEFMTWQANVDQHGLKGLRATRVQQYRN